jgi:hypothetical protein
MTRIVPKRKARSDLEQPIGVGGIEVSNVNVPGYDIRADANVSRDTKRRSEDIANSSTSPDSNGNQERGCFAPVRIAFFRHRQVRL